MGWFHHPKLFGSSEHCSESCNSKQCGCWGWRSSVVSSQDAVSEGSQSMFGNPSQWQVPLAGRIQTHLWVKFDPLQEQDVTPKSHQLRSVAGGLRKYVRTEHRELVLFRAQHGGKREVTKHKNPRRHFPFPTLKTKLINNAFPATQIKCGKGLPTVALDLVLGGP